MNVNNLFLKNELVNPNLIKQDMSILFDISYVKNNLTCLGLKFSEFPDELKNNQFFVLEYFSNIATDKKEYKLIPTNLLSEQFFVSACLEKNPDIYLMADTKCHTEHAFKTLRANHPHSFLKYAKESDLNNFAFCQEALKLSPFNFKYLPEKLRSDITICKQVLKHDSYVETVAKNIPDYCKQDSKFITELLNTNELIFSYIPKHYRVNEDLCFHIVKKNTVFFKDVDESLKSNKVFVERLLKHKEDAEKSYNTFSVRNFNIEHILVQVPNSFYTKDFSLKYKDKLNRCFSDLPKEHRSNTEIIKAVYESNKKNNDREVFQSKFLNKITDIELQNEIKNFVQQFERREILEAQKNIISVIETFELKRQLQNELPTNQITTKKMKI